MTSLLEVQIRQMTAADVKNIAHHFCPPWSTTNKMTQLMQTFYEEQKNNIRTVGILEKDKEILGYGTLLRKSQYPYFSKIPEISTLWIDDKYRRHGLATRLILWLEELARSEGYKQIGIAVGLYQDYGPAQKLYSKLGYALDGNGITYKYKLVTPGEKYPVDDDLLLWLVKPL